MTTTLLTTTLYIPPPHPDLVARSRLVERLFIAVGTVKRHVNNIYGKLGLHSRTQAVARAQELELI